MKHYYMITCTEKFLFVSISTYVYYVEYAITLNICVFFSFSLFLVVCLLDR